MVKRRPTRKLNVYSNLSHRRKTKKDAVARKKAEYLASLPKHPVKRALYRMHPKRFWGYWFSKRGAIMALKITGVAILFCFLIIGGLFAYYRKDLDSIRPSELAKNVQTTVTRYYDRNGVLLWEDKGDGNYKLVVDGNEISDNIKKATVAIEDKDFYHHHGISITGTLRAAINNATGGNVQGGSTLTQQLVKQVFFSDETSDRGLGGIPRKIKEAILAIEVERMYNKDQILDLYLNESPYGGRRNGVESGAETYFGKHAKDLTLAQASLLAAIPQNPSLYNPYNVAGNQALITRQHIVLDNMVAQNMITKAQADQAKAVPIIDTIKPESSQYNNIKAPHFVLTVKAQLEKEFGIKTMRQGGLTIKTTLDYKAQKYAEQAVKDSAQFLPAAGADNMALSSVDVKTGQVIAMVGSVDYNKPVYGETNAATSLLEPGSSIKPIADYSTLFKQRSGVNYGPGSILKDENIDSVYCGADANGCHLSNYSNSFYGSVPIRKALAGSLNIPAVKAMYIAGVTDSINTAHDLGDLSYCNDNPSPGLSSAIGGGCRLRQIEHTNAYASLARGGTYEPLSYVLSVKNASGETLKQWKDNSKRVLDPQVAYMLTSILSDANARTITFGGLAFGTGFNVPNVITATKTGTTENGEGKAKDMWMMSYSPAIATGVWAGNHDGSPLAFDNATGVRNAIGEYMENAHINVYEKEGRWKPGDGFTKPAGIKTMTVNGITDIWPSWYQKTAGQTSVKMTFDKFSKRKATNCTPDGAKVELDVSKMQDPITKKDVIVAPDGYDATKDDNIHKCSDRPPSATLEISGTDAIVTIAPGSHKLDTFTITINGQAKTYRAKSGAQSVPIGKLADNSIITVVVHDSVGYDSEPVTQKYTTSGSPDSTDH